MPVASKLCVDPNLGVGPFGQLASILRKTCLLQSPYMTDMQIFLVFATMLPTAMEATTPTSFSSLRSQCSKN